jgi:hypothetical protein
MDIEIEGRAFLTANIDRDDDGNINDIEVLCAEFIFGEYGRHLAGEITDNVQKILNNKIAEAVTMIEAEIKDRADEAERDAAHDKIWWDRHA